MSCPGIHCPGCSGGQSLGILAAAAGVVIVAAGTVQYVADRIWWIGGTLAACFVLATAAGMWLEARSDRRAAEWGAARGIRSRADVILPAPPPRRELPTVVSNYFYIADASMGARVIRQALPVTVTQLPPGNHDQGTP